MATGIFK